MLGQSIFGPTITCVFFAATLIANSGLAAGLKQLPQKVRQDLLVTWSSGLCYWPFVDLVCYSIVPVKWIPLGYNLASFFCNSRCRPIKPRTDRHRRLMALPSALLCARAARGMRPRPTLLVLMHHCPFSPLWHGRDNLSQHPSCSCRRRVS